MKKENAFKEYFYDFLAGVFGSVLYSVAVNIFATPNNIAQGGVIGVAMLLNHIFPVIPTGVFSFGINLPIFLVAWRKIGGKFIFKSFLVNVLLSFFIDFFAFLPEYKGDTILAALFCGVMSGSALAVIFVRSMTTGGTDIIANLIRLKHPRISVGRIILISDYAVVILSLIVYGNVENSMYSLILIFVSTRVLDRIIYGISDSKVLMIITKKHQIIASGIMKEFGRGVSIIPVDGAYTGEQKKMLICAVRKNESLKIVKLIEQTDKNSFTIILNSAEISGLGFEKNKI